MRCMLYEMFHLFMNTNLYIFRSSSYSKVLPNQTVLEGTCVTRGGGSKVTAAIFRDRNMLHHEIWHEGNTQ